VQAPVLHRVEPGREEHEEADDRNDEEPDQPGKTRDDERRSRDTGGRDPPTGDDVAAGPSDREQEGHGSEHRPGAAPGVEGPDADSRSDDQRARQHREDDAHQPDENGKADTEDDEVHPVTPFGGDTAPDMPGSGQNSPGRTLDGVSSAVRLLLVQPLGLVLDVQSDVGVGRRVAACVVSTEQQLTAGKHHTDVRLRAAAVAAVCGGQRGGCRRGHASM